MSLKCSEAETQQKEPLPSEKVTTQLHRLTCGRNMSEQHAVYNKDLIPRPCNTASTWLAINENYISQNVSHQHHRHNICKVLKMQTKLLRLGNFDILPQVERTVSNQIKQSISVIWSYVICSDDPRMAISHSYDHMSKGHMSTWSCWVIHRTCLWTQLGKQRRSNYINLCVNVYFCYAARFIMPQWTKRRKPLLGSHWLWLCYADPPPSSNRGAAHSDEGECQEDRQPLSVSQVASKQSPALLREL